MKTHMNIITIPMEMIQNLFQLNLLKTF